MIDIQIGFSLSDDGDIEVNCKSTNKARRTRIYKGTSVNMHVNDYCVIDLETTGVFVNSADIIEISAIKIRSNKVVDEFSALVNPECHIPEEATAVNHITDDMVKDSPVLDDILDDFISFIGNDVIVGYNNAGFDMNLIYDCVYRLRNAYFTNDYLDMLHAVRRSLPNLKNSKLETVSKFYGFDTTGEHRALKDCYLTKACYDKLNEEFGEAAFKKAKINIHTKKERLQYSAETRALQELQKILDGALADGKVSVDEVEVIRCWLEEHRDLSGNYPFDKVFNALDDVLEDGIITEEELSDLNNIFSEIIDPVKCKSCKCNEIKTLMDKHICLTGEFDYGSKGSVEELIKAAGGIIDKSVKKATNYVVVGAQGSDAWKTGNYGSKIQKAMELIDKGQAISIVEEKDFITATKCLIE